jgi:DNA-binding transcriptional ArsR family regulator
MSNGLAESLYLDDGLIMPKSPTEPPVTAPPTAMRGESIADLDCFRQQAGKASDFLKALAHESRLLLLCLVAERERSVTELETILSLRQPAVSQQLARLRMDGLVTTRRDGKVIYYSLASDDVRKVMGVLFDIFCREAAGENADAVAQRFEPRSGE